GCLWSPAAQAGPVPLILIGHGGRSEKRNPGGLALARRLVRHEGFAAVAIDAVDHGERGPIRESNLPAYENLWRRHDTFDRMNADWSATLDAVIELPEIDPARVGYWASPWGRCSVFRSLPPNHASAQPCLACVASRGRARNAADSATAITPMLPESTVR